MTTDFDNLPPSESIPDPGGQEDSTAYPQNEADAKRAEYMRQPAPYGRFNNGKPRKSPPKGKGGSRSATTKGTDYTEGVKGMFQMVGTGLAIAGAKSESPAFLADAVAIADHAHPVATALNDLAHERPEVAAVLDKLMQVGPYGAVIAAVLPLAAQLLTNHGVAPAGLLGSESPETLVSNAMGDSALPSQNGKAPAR